MQRKILALGVMLAIVSMSLGANATHINGTDVDTVATTANGSDTILNSNWFSGTTVRFDTDCDVAIDANECNDPFTVGDAVNQHTASDCETEDPTTDDAVCDTILVDQPVVTQGLVLCESNTLNPFVSDANAGYGGKCSSSDDAALAFAYDNWNSVNVTKDIDAGGCALVVVSKMTVFARVGNNAHGLEVASDESFLYRDLIAFLVDGGHVTYFMKAEEVTAGSDQLDCWGGDEHTDAGAGSASWSGAVCNDLQESAAADPTAEDGVAFDAFAPTTYEALDVSSTTETYDAQTVCVIAW